jgi:hypothetical protein
VQTGLAQGFAYSKKCQACQACAARAAASVMWWKHCGQHACRQRLTFCY